MLPTFSEDPLTHSWNPTASCTWSSRETLKQPREGRSWILCTFVSCYRRRRGNFPDEAVTCLDSTSPNPALPAFLPPCVFSGAARHSSNSTPHIFDSQSGHTESSPRLGSGGGSGTPTLLFPHGRIGLEVLSTNFPQEILPTRIFPPPSHSPKTFYILEVQKKSWNF